MQRQVHNFLIDFSCNEEFFLNDVTELQTIKVRECFSRYNLNLMKIFKEVLTIRQDKFILLKHQLFLIPFIFHPLYLRINDIFLIVFLLDLGFEFLALSKLSFLLEVWLPFLGNWIRLWTTYIILLRRWWAELLLFTF